MLTSDSINKNNNLNSQKILFIGGGNIANAIISGLTSPHNVHINTTHNNYTNHITVLDRNKEKLIKLKQLFNINTINNIKDLDFTPDIIILAVKPLAIQTACQEIFHDIKANTLVISVAAAVNIKNLNAWLPKDTNIIRAMPNTPVAIKMGVTILYTQDNDKLNISIADDLFTTLGMTIWVNTEEEITPSMAISGCGPAYVLLLCESLMTAAEKLNINNSLAKKLICHTISGTSELFNSSNKSAQTLRNDVTSPNGTTHAAIEVLEPSKMHELYTMALQAAVARAKAIEGNLIS